MKTLMRLSTLFILFLGILSCKNIPENEEIYLDNILTKKQSLAKINILGAKFDNNNLENDIIAENNTWGGGNSLISNDLQASVAVNILDDAYTANIAFPNGKKYVVHAFCPEEKYEGNTCEPGKLVDGKLCEVGKTCPALVLNAGERYNIITYAIVNEDFHSEHSIYDDSTYGGFLGYILRVLYQKISNYEAVYGETTLNIVLKPSYSNARFIIDTYDLKNVSSISLSNVKLSGVHYTAGRYSIMDGIYRAGSRCVVVNTTECESKDISIEMSETFTKVFESNYINIHTLDGISNGHLSFDVEVTGSGGSKTVQKSVPISIKVGTKNTYTIKLKGDAFPPPPPPPSPKPEPPCCAPPAPGTDLQVCWC